jgi:hypothetical protein
MARDAIRSTAPDSQARHVLTGLNARPDWLTLDQAALDALLRAHGAGAPRHTTLLADTRTRWEFRDGSALVEQMHVLELGFPGTDLACWCWEATGHEDTCPERLGEHAAAWRHGRDWLVAHAGGAPVLGLFDEPTLAVSYRTGRGARRAVATGPEVARLGAALIAADDPILSAEKQRVRQGSIFTQWWQRPRTAQP